MNMLNRKAALGLLGCLILSAGCGAPTAQFQANWVYLKIQDKDDAVTVEQVRNVQEILEGLFGTPDEPHVPTIEGIDQLLDQAKLEMAAGPVASDESGKPQGLYRRHCAHCHGVTGDGVGPTAAWLNPYPRDYRRSIYKFKSTPKELPPTKDDLRRLLHEGVNGTAMPSFRVLPENEQEALLEYVIYLSLRGTVERELLKQTATKRAPGELFLDPAKKSSDPDLYNEAMTSVKDKLKNLVKSWNSANERATPIPDRPEAMAEAESALAEAQEKYLEISTDEESTSEQKKQAKEELTVASRAHQKAFAESAEIGRRLFHGEVAGCTKCHGKTALGDGVVDDYDNWTKEIGDPKDPKLVRKYAALGMLKPINIRPRNLRMGHYRGGRRPVDLFWRIHNGIAGTPMPAAAKKAFDAPETVKGLTDDDVWHIVDYVRSLPYESVSKPVTMEVTNQREVR